MFHAAMSTIVILALSAAAYPAETPSPPIGSGVIAALATTNQIDQAPVPTDAGEPPAAETADMVISPPRFTLWHVLILAASLLGLWLFFGRRLHRLDRPPPFGAPERPPAFSPLTGIGLFIGAIVFAQLGILLGGRALGIDVQQPLELRETALLTLSRYAGEAVIIAMFAVLVLTATKPQPDRRRGVAAAAIVGTGALLLCWSMVMSLTWLINLAQHVFRGTLPDPIAHETLVTLIEADRTVWFFIVAGIAIILAPIFEEVLYRGILQDTMVRLELPRWTAIVATSAIFAVMHTAAAPSPEALPAMLAALFVLSLGFGWVYEKTGRLAAPIVMHVLFNAGNLSVAMWTTV